MAANVLILPRMTRHRVFDTHTKWKVKTKPVTICYEDLSFQVINVSPAVHV